MKLKMPGIAVTASHSPANYIGLKLFEEDGSSISVTAEQSIRSTSADSSFYISEIAAGESRPVINEQAIEEYFNAIRKFAPPGMDFLLEVRNPWLKYFQKWLPEVEVLTRESTDPQRESAPDEFSGRLVFRIDEDADQVIAWKGTKRLDGQALLKRWVEVQKLEHLIVSCDVLEQTRLQWLKEKRNVVTTNIGDQYLVETAKKYHLKELSQVLCGEPNGHLIQPTFSWSPDAILASMRMAASLNQQWPDSENFSKYALRSVNYPMMEFILKSHGAKYEKGLHQFRLAGSRVLLRRSEFEESVVIQAEGKDSTTVMSELVSELSANDPPEYLDGNSI